MVSQGNSQGVGSGMPGEAARHQVTLLNRLLPAAVGFGLATLVALMFAFSGVPMSERLTALLPLVTGWLALLIAWRGQSIRPSTRVAALMIAVYILGITLLVRGRAPGSGLAWLLVPPVLALFLLGPRQVIRYGAISLAIAGAVGLAINQHWIIPQPGGEPEGLAVLATEGGSFAAVAIVLTSVVWISGRHWSGVIMSSLTATNQLQAQAGQLRATITRLQRESWQLHASADIAHTGSGILEPDELFNQLVNRIQGGFSQAGVTYVGLFLRNEAQRVAMLRAATGEVGGLLLSMGHRLYIDESSTVGRAIVHRQARIRNAGEAGMLTLDGAPSYLEGHSDGTPKGQEEGMDGGHAARLGHPAPLGMPMPEAKTEIALPLRARGRILGALSMLSTQAEAFTEADVAVLQTMADQVAVAIDNTVLYSQTRVALEHLRAVQQQYVSEAWSEFTAAKPIGPIEYPQPGAQSTGKSRLQLDFLRDAQRAAMVHGRTVATTSPPPGDQRDSESPQAALVVPLKLRGQVIGTIALHETDQHRSWTMEEIGLAENVAEQVSLTIENLRLMEQTQRRAARERMVSQVTANVRETLDIETVLKTAVRQIQQALGVPGVRIRLAKEEPPSGLSTGG